jgi:hypothetical protein
MLSRQFVKTIIFCFQSLVLRHVVFSKALSLSPQLIPHQLISLAHYFFPHASHYCIVNNSLLHRP